MVEQRSPSHSILPSHSPSPGLVHWSVLVFQSLCSKDLEGFLQVRRIGQRTDMTSLLHPCYLPSQPVPLLPPTEI